MVADVTLCGVAVAVSRNGEYYYTQKLAKTRIADIPVDQGPLYGPNNGDTNPVEQPVDQPNDQPVDQPNDQPVDEPILTPKEEENISRSACVLTN